MYFFSSLALTLNEQEDGVAPTDSRLRPDQRLMEEGLWDEANSQKQCLEERQRQERKRREAQSNQALEEGETKENNKEEAFYLLPLDYIGWCLCDHPQAAAETKFVFIY